MSSIPVSLSSSIVSSGSWASVFASASKIKLVEENEDNLPPLSSANDLKGLSDLAGDFLNGQTINEVSDGNEHRVDDDCKLKEKCEKLTQKSKKKKKRKIKDNGDKEDESSKSKRKKYKKVKEDTHEEDSSLEGKMINGKMVLIDKRQNKVFDACERKNDGSMVEIGILSEGNVVLHDESHNPGVSFPYPTDEDDHCETPLIAYQHIISLLNLIKHSPSDIKIYDPYYCNGSIKEHFSSLGFPNVYNKKKDCYKVWTKLKTPSHDILITNPPYSDDHIEKLIQYVASQSKPFFLLLPVFVHKKKYYIQAIEKKKPFYVFPKKRYIYCPPKDFRAKKKSDTHKKNSPFVSMWYCWGGDEHHEKMLKWISKNKIEGCEIARSKSALRDLRRNAKKK